MSLDAVASGGSERVFAEAMCSGGPLIRRWTSRFVDREAVKPRLAARLPQRDREILYLRFFGDMTRAGLPQRFGISQMHVVSVDHRGVSADSGAGS